MRFRSLPHLPGLLLALLSMAAWAAEAETPPSLRFRRVLLTAKTEVVPVARGIPTTLTFDAELDVQAVKRGAPDGVRLLSISESSVTLMAEGDLGEGVALRVPLLNAPTPPAVVVTLVAAEDVADTQVMFFRSAPAPEGMHARLAELEARGAACEAELATQRERARAMGPAGWVLSGQVGEEGVASDRLKQWSNAGTAGMSATDVRRFRAHTWVVLEVEVENETGQPWRPGRAWLEGASTGRVEARTVAMAPEVLAPKKTARVSVEFGGPPGKPGEGFALVVEGADGTRPLSVSGVVIEDKKQEKSGP
ncbi:DUF2381 family protein [Myxococcus sp. RHSTA-1-4]|uniref:DUF2381 family protein n=1 Tax=Myxococcus sp. RHSTA-1-4 TaxID=2874601 RepID=UPI001CBF97CE|nr:DUF2381 family protein [Myxococcus sp. RHSTA-1-4]MBZ4418832.1 DUF2381 family protein [Myxococcus sp. RHSTA-1-4]